ncbi:hypothetical protein LAC81_09190 [Ensifer adhaerens]|uniref:hypothetical protein n=1 Tax=Ensifer adhaerens TaxID=106592 RepID=UPI001CBF10C3|nr:hypothetical protein [Ensifer adhaerens]MBZ7921956.1 hypothetical protein [Ensifer adhaerens]UAX94351.1 hypothetical protein LAC78_09185 [Ensifer adhaerens]UAY01986.1 hypothetical protein LAC80_09195 [Ensifer adhaerens]UAY09369.1 hypothetical protein LAC81_09190 [Ensifer adhaerens]
MSIVPSQTPFTFRERPAPVPGDLRISWRFALNLLILVKSRGKRSSLARLYILNDGTRSFDDADLLGDILVGAAKLGEWRVKVEPALGRALDLMVGEGLLAWTTVSDRLGVELSASGLALASEIHKDDSVMAVEKGRIEFLAPLLTEGRVIEFLKVRPNNAVHDL